MISRSHGHNEVTKIEHACFRNDAMDLIFDPKLWFSEFSDSVVLNERRMAIVFLNQILGE